MGRHDIEYILNCFKDMGVNDEELEKESQKLLADTKYCDSWLKTSRGSRIKL